MIRSLFLPLSQLPIAICSTVLLLLSIADTLAPLPIKNIATSKFPLKAVTCNRVCPKLFVKDVA